MLKFGNRKKRKKRTRTKISFFLFDRKIRQLPSIQVVYM